MKMVLALLALVLALPALAEQPEELVPDETGEVRVPLAAYTAMLNQLTAQPRPAPAAYAIGQAEISVAVSERDGRVTATVDATFQIETFEPEWTLVQVLPPGAALRAASVDGAPVRLVEGPDGLGWSTDRAGTVTMRLAYGVDATRHDSGYALPLPMPRAAAANFTLTYPGTGIDLAVIPSADMTVAELDGTTRLTAAVPATSSVLVTWRAPDQRPFAISRAHYQGELSDEALHWTAELEVEAFTGERITLPVMPNSVTLSEVSIDGQPTTVLDEDGSFAVRLQGRGMHRIAVAFQAPLAGADGAPQARLAIPRIPVSRFDLTLPGRKQVTVVPAAAVVTTELDEATKATAYIPMGDSVLFTWTEAIPEELRVELRANASLYHRVHADEGVLHGLATIVYEITHGEAGVLELDIPHDAQVNRIDAPAGGVSDWAVVESDVPGLKAITVFLDRPVTGEYVLEVSYERLLGVRPDAEAPIAVPLLSARNVQRQRGMVALLSGPELTLEPVTEASLSKVGENQLPAFIRDQITMTVAHTYKYTEARPELTVAAVAPERKQGVFDAQVDTLISLGDVTMRGSATVEIDVKSGTIQELALRVPAQVNVLGVSGPSLRTHQVRAADGAQAIDLAFTREMEGQFRIEVNYERIMDGDAPESGVATVSVDGAEVEHGRIAIEALTAVEVQAATVDQLTGLDINELPQQLVLKTTNPILLAYRYVRAGVPVRLGLKITRHREIDVQVAVIETAEYGSLFTGDGLAVTSARLTVRNSRKQFLRLALPAGSEVWSVFVDGKPEKPAYAGNGAAGANESVLIKMINSAEGFPVDIVYATPVASIDHFGALASRLPRPDMVVTRTRWDVFLPVGPSYFTPDSTMDITVEGVPANPRATPVNAVALASDALRAQMGQPLRIVVPTQGIRFAFEKLYADQSSDEAEFTIRYVSEDANSVGLALSAAGAVLLWIGVVAIGGRRLRLNRAATIACVASGAALVALSIGYLGADPLLASGVALLIAVALAAWWGVERWRVRAA